MPEEAVLNNAGVRSAMAGRYEEAHRCFAHAVEVKPDYLPGQKNLLAACVRMKRWDEALKAAEKAEALHPLSDSIRGTERPADEAILRGLREESVFIANLGWAYQESGRMEAARDRFTLLCRIAPDGVAGCNGLAEVAFRRGEWQESLRLCAQSLQLKPEQPEVVALVERVREAVPEMDALARSVLAQRAGPGVGPPASRAPSDFRPIRDLELPVRDPEPVVRLAKAPVLRVPQPASDPGSPVP